MNLRQLACFVAVVDEGSFTRAARAIGIAQPSLSQHIRALEEDLDGRLIERLPRGIALTPAGRVLLPEARAAVRAVERGRRGARAALALETGELEIATVLSMAVGLLPRYIRTWRERYPDVGIRLHEFRHRSLLEDAVEQGIADFAIGPLPVRAWDGPLAVIAWEEFVDRRPTDRSARRPPLDPARRARRPRMGAVPPGSRARGDPRGDVPPGRVQPARIGADIAGGGGRSARVGRARAGARPRQHRPARDRRVGAATQPADDPRGRRLRAHRVVARSQQRSSRCSARSRSRTRATP